MTIYEKRVDAGVEYLDQYIPDWYKKIDLEELSMEDSCNCILGQIHGNYRNVINEDCATDKRWARDRGFSAWNAELFETLNYMEWSDYVKDYYAHIEPIWIEKIEKKLAEDGLM